MQDLEELKFRVAVYAESGLTEMARDLIARCESAEKDCESWGILCKQAGIERDAAMSELKELREQKPYGYLVRGNFFHQKDYAQRSADYITANYENIEPVPVYIEPVAQSQDSAAELRNYIENCIIECAEPDALDDPTLNDLRQIATGIRDLRANLLQSNANDHIEPNTPEIPDSSNCSGIPNGSDHIADERKLVAAGFQIVPIEPTPSMLDAGVAMALQVSVHGQGGWSKYIAALYAQLLSAAPQVSAEQKDKIFKIGSLAATLDCIDMDEAWARQDIFDIVTELTGKSVAEMFAAAKQSTQDEVKE